MGTHEIVGGVVSPVHDSYGKKDLEPSYHRISMLKVALKDHDWVRLSEWECRQESWSRTRQVLQYHQVSMRLQRCPHLYHPVDLAENNNRFDVNESDTSWIPENVKNNDVGPVKIKLLCGADLLESFGTPGLWADADVSYVFLSNIFYSIVGCWPRQEMCMLSPVGVYLYRANIMMVTEWIRNEISSTKIRRALRRSESVRYLLPDNVIDYIHEYNLYGSKKR
nr:unnamed protein product [Callosobruchus chinensis]